MIFDVIIVGGGPCGLAAAAAAHRAGLSYVVLERGCVANSIRRYPTNMRFFSTAEKLAIDGVPFVSPEPNPTRREALDYYRQVVAHRDLNIRQYEEAVLIERSDDGAAGGGPLFTVETRPAQESPGRDGGGEDAAGSPRSPRGAAKVYRGRSLVAATGYFDSPNRLGIPGEDLPGVSHYYTEGHPFFRQRVVVVGGRNSAVEAALDLFRCGARVTLVHRGDDLSDRIKPWILPFVRSRLEKGDIESRFNSRLTAIEPGRVTVAGPDGREQLPADFVFILTGFRPDHGGLRALGVGVDDETGRPTYDPDTMETNVPGLYVAGVLAAGYDANKIFIENGRFHGLKIVRHLLQKTGAAPEDLDELLPLPEDPDAVDDPALTGHTSDS